MSRLLSLPSPVEPVIGAPVRLTFPERLDLGVADVDNAIRLYSEFGRHLIYCQGYGWGVWLGRAFDFAHGKDRAFRVCARLPELLEEEATAFWEIAIEPDDVRDRMRLESLRSNPRFNVTSFEEAEAFLRTELWAVRKNAARGAGQVKVIEAAQRALRTLVPLEPCDLEGSPHRFVVANGAIDLSAAAGQVWPEGMSEEEELRIRRAWLRPHSQDGFPIKSSPVEYDPAAKGPNWRRFLNLVMPDPVNERFLQRVLGMCLSGRNEVQKMLMMRGGGGNGKSTLMAVIARIFGSYAVPVRLGMFVETGHEESPSAHTAAEMPMVGARLYLTAEPKPTHELAVDKIKGFTGGDPRNLRAPHAHEASEYRPRGVPVMQFNRLPKIKAEDEGTKDRLVFVPFEARLRDTPHERPQAEIEAELWEEAPAILNWLIDGYAAFRAEGLAVPEKAERLKSSLLSRSDPIGEFIEMCCVKDPEGLIPKKDFHAVFRAWCQDTTAQEFSRNVVNALMPEKGFPEKKTHGGRMYWTGLSWAEHPEVSALLDAAKVVRAGYCGPPDEAPDVAGFDDDPRRPG